MAWYSTGTVAVTLNSPTVTGTGTTFSANVRVGDAFRGPDGRWYEVTNVASSTVISIKPSYQGSTASGQSYSVAPVLGYDKDLSDRFNQLAMTWGSTLAGLQPWSTAPTGGAAMDAMGFGTTGKALAATANAAAARGAIGASAVGENGWGLQASASNTLSDANVSLANGLYRVTPNTAGTMLGAYVGQMIHAEQDGGYAVQLGMSVAGPPVIRMRQRVASTWQAPVTVYHSQNLLGSVSVSGGVPTGAVVERGSNTNGEYVRYADGTQICWINMSVTDQALDTAYGSLFTGTRSWTFPVSFAGSPAIAVGLFRWGTGAGWGTGNGIASATAATLRGFDIVSRAVGTATVISATAVGRWF
ncbi:TPA: hypothetical protein N2A36_000326 [Pseudomonas aeruginosa]|nr:hypothetical protein [Pseudomonas aeruginosa]